MDPDREVPQNERRDDDQPDAAPRSRHFLLVMLLFSLGSCGAIGGTQGLSNEPSALIQSELSGAEAEAYREFDYIQRSSPYRVPANLGLIAVSLMLLIAGAHVALRHPSAPWITINALVAKMLWVLAEAGTESYYLLSRSAEVDGLVQVLSEGRDVSTTHFVTAAAFQAVIHLLFLAYFVGWVRRWAEVELKTQDLD